MGFLEDGGMGLVRGCRRVSLSPIIYFLESLGLFFSWIGSLYRQNFDRYTDRVGVIVKIYEAKRNLIL
jgi:hypothetical protein